MTTTKQQQQKKNNYINIVKFDFPRVFKFYERPNNVDFIQESKNY